VLTAIQGQPELGEVLAHPFLELGKKQALIKAIVGAKAPDVVHRFLDLLMRKHRLSLLDLIVRELNAEADHQAGVVTFQVVSAYPMTPASEKVLAEALSKQVGLQVHMNVQVNPALIGGFTAQSNDHSLDLSLSGQLKAVEQSFLSN